MADTFDSRLKLRLQESGGNSGQWGDLLNQTITNVASVFGFGTHQLTADSNATLTLADDGASLDALKSSYLKITSSVSLTATRTLTFSPNTFNQVKYVENNTTGGQSITLSQGSGANITIENGATKIVYFDGAGSGAAVVDALAKIDFDNAAEFTTLKVTNIQANDGTASMTLSNSTGNVAFPASIDVSGTSNFDVVDIDGAVDMASTLAVGAKVTIDPADGIVDDDFALFVRNNEATAGRNFGLMIRAGSNSSDESFTVRNLDNSLEFFTVHGDGSTVFNESGADADFRVESDLNTHAFFVNGEYKSVIGMATSSPVSYANGDTVLYLHGAHNPAIALSDNGQTRDYFITAQGSSLNINYADGSNSSSASNVTTLASFDNSGEVTMTRADNGVNLTLECTDTDANAGPNLKLNRAVTGASDDEIGNVIFHGRDNAGNGEDYGLIAGFISDATNGSEDGRLNFKVLMDGTSRDYLILNGGGSVVVNQDAQDVDFRVESTGFTHQLFVDAANNTVGIGRVPSSMSLDLESNSSGTLNAFRIRNSNAAAGAEVKQHFSLNRTGSSIDFECAGIVAGKEQEWTTTAATVDGFMAFRTIRDETTAERARITSNGHLLVATTNESQVSGNGVKLNYDNTNSNGRVFVVGGSQTAGESFSCYANGAYRFYVAYGGQVFSTNTSIGGISDERLKENIVDLETGLDEVMALKPRRFDWKDGQGSGKKNVAGFIAQEVEPVLSDLIEDFLHDDLEDAKAIRTGDLIPTLVKAIQEQQAQIESLKAEVEALKNG